MTLVLFPIRQTYPGLVKTESTLSRIRRLWKSRGFTSERAFLRACRLSEGYIANLRSREQGGGEVTITLDAAVKMARVLGVHAEQLATDDYIGGDREDPYPERYWAIEAARFIGLPEAAMRSVANDRPPHDLSRQAWFKRIEAAAQELADRPSVVPLLPGKTAEQA